MIEIDQLYWTYNKKKKYVIHIMAFFMTRERSDEILEVGGIESTLMNLNMN
jgi:hypothetical protein